MPLQIILKPAPHRERRKDDPPEPFPDARGIFRPLPVRSPAPLFCVLEIIAKRASARGDEWVGGGHRQGDRDFLGLSRLRRTAVRLWP